MFNRNLMGIGIFVANENLTRTIPTNFAPFLVGAFSLKEKSLTLTVSSFFYLFFSADNLTLSGPLFLQFVHLSYLFIFDQAGERGFDSRTKP